MTGGSVSRKSQEGLKLTNAVVHGTWATQNFKSIQIPLRGSCGRVFLVTGSVMESRPCIAVSYSSAVFFFQNEKEYEFGQNAFDP